MTSSCTGHLYVSVADDLFTPSEYRGCDGDYDFLSLVGVI